MPLSAFAPLGPATKGGTQRVGKVNPWDLLCRTEYACVKIVDGARLLRCLRRIILNSKRLIPCVAGWLGQARGRGRADEAPAVVRRRRRPPSSTPLRLTVAAGMHVARQRRRQRRGLIVAPARRCRCGGRRQAASCGARRAADRWRAVLRGEVGRSGLKWDGAAEVGWSGVKWDEAGWSGTGRANWDGAG